MKREALERYPLLKMEVEHQLERLIRARNNTELPAKQDSDGTRKQSVGVDRLGNAVSTLVDLEDRLLPSIEAAIEEMIEIETAVNALYNPLESEILYLRYLDGEHGRLVPWKKVAMRLYGDDDEKHLMSAYRLHGRALKSWENQ